METLNTQIVPLLVNIVGVILLLVASWGAIKAVGFIETKAGADYMKWVSEELAVKESLASTAVRFAEQFYGQVLKGPEKFEIATKWLSDRLEEIGIIVYQEEIQGLIEAAVREFKDVFGEEWAELIKRE